MRSAKSYFNGTLFQKNLTRFWPVWGIYLVVWLFVFPIQLILDSDYGAKTVIRFVNRTVLEHIVEVGLPLAVIFALLAAVAVWSYLFNNRSACLMHTLAIRREGLFLTNFLSGMTFMAAPNLVVFALTLLAELAVGEVDIGALVMWFFALTLMELFFFCFATFCAMCTGHILGLPALYGVFNVLAVGVTTVVDLALDRFVFGYAGAEGLFALAEWLTPAQKLANHLEVRRDMVNGSYVDTTAWLSGFGYVLVYMILGLILALCALALYRRRHMERAGDVITVAWMRPVFQYGVAFCCALALGTLLFEIFRGTLSDTAWTLLAFMLLSGVVGYFAAKMLLEKSFRVFSCWRGCLPLLAALVVLTCVMEFDLSGFERRVPEMDEVESVYIGDISTKPYDEAQYVAMETADPEIVRAVLEIHQAIVDSKKAIESDPGGMWGNTENGYSVEERSHACLDVTYYMEDGKSIGREYEFYVSAEDLNDPGSLTAKMNALVNMPRMIEMGYGLSDESADDIIEMTLDCYYMNEGYDGYEDVAISKDAYETVFNAVMADFAEGNIGRRYLMDDEERMNSCFVNDLTIVLYRGKRDDNSKTVTEMSYGGAMVTMEPVPIDTGESVVTERITVTLQTTSRHTLAALAQLGVLEKEVSLMTQAQMEMASNAWYENEKSVEKTDLTDYIWDVLGE